MRTRLLVALAVSAAAACSLTLVPGVLGGVPVMNGSARGTAVVGLVVSALVLLTVPGVARGSVRWVALAAGGAAYLTYNAVLFAFATPFNAAFLCYEAMLGTAIVTLVVLAGDLSGVSPLPAAAPRWVAVYMGMVVVLNALAWLREVVPAVLDDEPADLMAGSGLTTSPVYVQDLAVWLPLMGWLALWVWRDSPRAVAWACGGLAFWVLEAAGIAVDQWFGHRADPASTWASAGAVPLFAAAAVVGVLPLVTLLRALPDTLPDQGTAQEPPTRRPVSSSQRSRT